MASVAVAEHLRIAGLVAGTRREEATALLSPLVGGRRTFGFRQRGGAAIGRDQRDQIGKLLRLECEKLIAGLGRLQCALRALALADEVRHLGAVRIDIADNAGLGPNGTSVAPTGKYADWMLGADVAVGPVVLGVAYVDTDISAAESAYLQPNFSHTKNGSSIAGAAVVVSGTVSF